MSLSVWRRIPSYNIIESAYNLYYGLSIPWFDCRCHSFVLRFDNAYRPNALTTDSYTPQLKESKIQTVFFLSEMHFELYREKLDKKEMKYNVLIHLTFEMEKNCYLFTFLHYFYAQF